MTVSTKAADETPLLACVAPALRFGRSAPLAIANAQAIVAAVRALQATDLRLVLLPAGCLSGGAGLESRQEAAAALDVLRALAVDRGICVAGADRFGEHGVGFLLGPVAGQEAWQPSITDGQGAADVVVLETPFASIACLPEADVLHAEYVRLALFRGAEIILNPAAECSDERSGARHLARGARAWENFAFVASCSGGRVDSQAAGVALQEIWHHSGHLLLRDSATTATARLDLPSLRARRSEPWVNFPAQLRTALYAREYEAAVAKRNNGNGSIVGTHTVAAPAATEPIEAYDVLLMQSHQAFVAGPETRDATIAANLQQALGLARLFAMRPATRLVVFPEFFLQGAGASHPQEYWERCGIRIPGPETEALAAFARACNVYVSGAVLEYDPSWPRRYFNTALIIAPSGEIVLRYRKLQCADLNGLLNVTTPGNVYSEYVARYGPQSLVPVVDTPIGRLGTLICFDSNWPELWRSLALKGAEVICNPTSEIHSNRRPYWYQAKRAHAAENLLYVASANAGSEQFFPGAPVTSMNRGHSALIDYHGELVACADGPGVVPLIGRVEIGALRRIRAALADDPRVRFRPEAVADAYAKFPGFPLDCFLDVPMESAAEGPALVIAQVERLRTLGVLRRA